MPVNYFNDKWDEVTIRGRYVARVPQSYALCLRTRTSGKEYMLGHFYTECYPPGLRRAWSWASLPGLWPKQHKGPSWVGHEAELFGGRCIEGMGLLTTDGRRCWINVERRWA